MFVSLILVRWPGAAGNRRHRAATAQPPGLAGRGGCAILAGGAVVERSLDVTEEAPDTATWQAARPRAMFFLNLANFAVRGRLEEALREHEVTGIQYTALATIGARAGISSAELSRRFFVTPQTMNELIAGLERRRLILRKEDPANRRILKMRLTASGRRLLAACDAVADRVEAEVFGGLAPEAYEALRSITRRVAREIREADARRKGG